MAFPSAVFGGANSGANVTTTSVDIAARVGTPNPGDLVIILIVKDGTGAFTWPATPAFTAMTGLPVTFAPANNQGVLDARYRVWQAGDSTTVSITHASEGTAHQVYRITAGTWDSGTPPTLSATSGDSSNPDPPNHSPAWGAADNLWIGFAANDGNTAITAGSGGSWTDFQNDRWANANGVGIASDRLKSNAASVNPAAFTMATEQWGAATLAVKPAANPPDMAPMWQPTFPPFFLPVKFNPGGSATGPCFVPPDPGPPATPTFGGQYLGLGRSVIFQSLAFVALVTTPPPDVPAESWAPSYPNAIPAAPALLTAAQQAFAKPPLPPPVPSLAWAPSYPDQIASRPALLTALQKAWTAPDRQPLPRPGWGASFPDWISRRVLPTADTPAFFYTSALPNLPPPPLTWQPSYPDAHRKLAGLLSAAQQSLAYTSSLPQLPVPSLAWKGVFPDQVQPRSFFAGHQQALAFVQPIAPPAAVAIDWLPSYPSQFVAARTVPPGGLAGPIAPVTPPGPSVAGWLGTTYPIISPTAGTIELGRSALVVPPEVLHWQPIYPSAFPPRSYILPSGAIVPPVVAAPAPALSWAPHYPSAIPDRRSLTTAQHQFLARPTLPPPVPALSWAAKYQNRIPASPALPTALQRAWFGPDRQPEPRPGWTPTFPDRIARSTLPTAAYPAFFYTSALPNLPPPPLTWQPVYPNILLRAKAGPPLNGWSGPVLPPPVPPLTWQPIYPSAFVVPRLPVLGGAVAPFSTTIPPAAPPLSWKPIYPDLLFPGPLGPPLPAWSGPIAPPSAPLLSWQPVYPAGFILARQPILAGVTVAPFTPAAPPAPVLSWTPRYPDFFVVIRLGGSPTQLVEPIPPPVIPPATASTLIFVSASFGTLTIVGTIKPVP
jgi:hypothetical protein